MRIANYDPTLNLINCFIEPGDKFYITVEELRKDNFDLQPKRISQYDYDLVAHYCSMVQYYIHQLKKG